MVINHHCYCARMEGEKGDQQLSTSLCMVEGLSLSSFVIIVMLGQRGRHPIILVLAVVGGWGGGIVVGVVVRHRYHAGTEGGSESLLSWCWW